MVLPCSCFFWWVHNHGTISPIRRDMGPLYINGYLMSGTVPGSQSKRGHMGELQSEFPTSVPIVFPDFQWSNWEIDGLFLGEVHATVFLSALDVGNSKIPLASYALGSYREGRCCIDPWAAPCKSHRLCASKQQILKSDIRTFNSDVGAPQNCHNQILDSLPRIGFRI